ncbi:unnamed protein product, partial [Chrysoparadoxa australica]
PSNLTITPLSICRAKDLPLLKEVARKFLCIMVSSAPSERVFSASGNLITNKRNRLSPANVEKMMLL